MTRSLSRIHIGPKKKIALVCSGGAVKAGAFHLGVALALREQGFEFLGASPDVDKKPAGKLGVSTYVGSSAGSIISTYLAAGFTLENIFNSFLGRKSSRPEDTFPRPLPKMSYRKLFKLRRELAKEQIQQAKRSAPALRNLLKGEWANILGWKWIRTSGFFSTKGLEEYLREQVLPSNNFEDLATDLFIVGTQLNHSRKIVFGKYDYKPPPHDPTCRYVKGVNISDACAASTALPPIYAPYEIKSPEGRSYHYIDGEIRDTLSTHIAVDTGADLVIASYTHQPYHYHKEVGSLVNFGLPAILVQSVYLLVEQKINQHRFHKANKSRAIDAVSKYCKQEKISDAHRDKIVEILCAELQHRPECDTIYIHPRPQDHQMFFKEHFSLSPDKMTDIVRSGFKAAIDVLRKYDFEDRAGMPAPQRAGA